MTRLAENRARVLSDCSFALRGADTGLPRSQGLRSLTGRTYIAIPGRKVASFRGICPLIPTPHRCVLPTWRDFASFCSNNPPVLGDCSS